MGFALWQDHIGFGNRPFDSRAIRKREAHFAFRLQTDLFPDILGENRVRSAAVHQESHVRLFALRPFDLSPNVCDTHNRRPAFHYRGYIVLSFRHVHKAGRLICVQYPGYKTVSYQYDAAGNRTRLTYPDSSYITYEYDQLNRMTAVKNSSGTALATYTYDSRSRRTGLDYVNGAGADYSYDAASRLLYVDNQTQNGQHKYAYSYDYVGNRLDMTVTDGSGVRKHLYTYDDIYQITAVDYPDSLSYLATDTTFNYDAGGNRTSVIDGSGTCNYTSNSLNQYTAAGSTSFGYDASGNMFRDGNYDYDYDPENRLIQVIRHNPPTQYLNNLSAYTQGGDAPWVADAGGFAKSGSISDDQESWMYINVSGSGTLRFQWSVSSEENCDYLEFYIGDTSYDSISGECSWAQKSYTITGSGTHRVKWRYYKDSSVSSGSDCGYVKAVTWQPDPPAPTLAQAADSFLAYTTGGGANWRGVGDASADWAESGAIGDSQESWMQTTVSGAGTFSFHWTVSSLVDDDYLEFYIDSVLQDSISGSVECEEKSYTITGTGTHTLKWRYVKDGSDSGGADRGQVDQVTWTGVIPNDPASDAWETTLSYVYDPAGRRIEKKYDDVTVLKYVYDGDHCIAEYDAYNHLRRKYIYGPGVDQPISMIESSGTYAGTYYYHFDGLGSVTALTNASGATAEVYEYDVYGRVGASVPAHPNRIMFTGREYDKETGLYYYRARYYNPQIGRFLQTDPIGYGDGMNWYAYCGNSPIGRTDPTGRWAWYSFQWVETGGGPLLGVQCWNDSGSVGDVFYFTGWLDLFGYVNGTGTYEKPGDFCDSNFNRSVFDRSIDAAQAGDPAYGGGSSGGGGATGSGGQGERVIVGTVPGPNGEPVPIWADAGTGANASIGSRTDNASSGTPEIMAEVFAETYLDILAAALGEVAFREVCGALRIGAGPIEQALARIKAGEKLPFAHDGTVFANREGLLPRARVQTYYHEYVVPTPGTTGPGAQRIVIGKGGEVYYTPDHYKSFIRIY